MRVSETLFGRNTLSLLSELELSHHALLLVVLGPLAAEALMTLQRRVGALRFHRCKRVAQLIQSLLLAKDVAELGGALSWMTLSRLSTCLALILLLSVGSASLTLVALEALGGPGKLGLHITRAHHWLLKRSQLLDLVKEVRRNLTVLLPRTGRCFHVGTATGRAYNRVHLVGLRRLC